MPSQLVKNDNVTFLVAKDFVWDGVQYKLGDDFDQNIAIGRIELLVRTRRIIPVVENSSVKPRHWHREVRLRSDVERRLGVSRDVVTALDQSPPVSELDSSEDLGFDPSEHSVNEVLDYVENHPDEALSVYALEEQGKNRSTLKSKLDDILNQQAEEENKEETNG